MRFFLLLFIAVPIVEMALLIKVGQWLGVVPTIALVLLTAVIGVALLRWQGFATVLRARERLERGDIPAEEVLEGLLLAIGGVLLLTPGFATDALGFACLLPPLRRLLVRRLLRDWPLAAGRFAGGNVYDAGPAADIHVQVIDIDSHRDPR